jgi:hypothetical protein
MKKANDTYSIFAITNQLQNETFISISSSGIIDSLFCRMRDKTREPDL